jgi:hypothetical protein
VTVSVIAAPIIRRSGNIAQQAATLSTASAELSKTVDLINLSSGTATTYYYVLPTSTGGDWPVQGQQVLIIATGTGVNSVWISGTATGRLELDQGKFIKAEYWNGHWWVISTTATIASAS